MRRWERIRLRIAREAVGLAAFAAGVFGAVGIIALTVRRPTLCTLLLVAYEAMVIVTAKQISRQLSVRDGEARG